MENIILDKFRGINFGFDQDKFFVEYDSCSRPVGNLREEFEKRAISLYENNPNLMLGLSSGLDSQTVLHSFFNQGIKIECAFLYYPTFNETEFANLKILEKKYGFKSIVVDIDPMACKDEVMHIWETEKIPPSQTLQKKFLEQLPPDLDFLQGINGPTDLYFSEKHRKWSVLETANSYEIFRFRSFLSVQNRTGKIIGWERIPEITLSLLTDPVITAFMYSYNYISNNKLVYKDGTKIPLMDNWDLYIKPFIYGKYWKDELEYFPKYQGPEGIDYVLNGNYHRYRKNLIQIPYDELMSHFKKFDSSTIRFYENYVYTGS
jgi:hypothetical protein